MFEVLICFVPRSSESIAEAKIGSIWIILATWIGREGPFDFRNSIIFLFFSCTSIIGFRA